MTAPSETFSAALQQFRGGQPRQAEETCRRILQMQPHHAPALHLLGVLAHQDGRNEEAVERLRQAIALQPSDSEYHYNLGVAQQVLGRSTEAMASYREALRLHPDNAAASNNLGQILLNLDQLEESQNCLLRATLLNPDYGEAHHNLALVHKRRGQLEEAVASFRQAVRCRPDDAAIHFQLGKALEECGRLVEAIDAFREIVRLQPDNALYRGSLGNLLTLRNLPAQALPHYEQALRYGASDSAHHCNMGNVLTQLGRPQEGESHCREAIRIDPGGGTAHHNLGAALAAQGRWDEALASIEEALRIRPDDPGALHCRALWWLQQGRFAEGWPEYEWRWKLPHMTMRERREPLWDGSPLNGRTILLWTEQGLGDTLQFVRFTSVLKRQGATVLLECQPPLLPLLSRCPGIDRLIASGSPIPDADAHAPLLSMPRLLGTTLDTIPAEVPYLFADPTLVEQWRRELAGSSSIKIGIAWQGNPLYGGDAMRSIPLKHFAALARLPGVRLFSLQKGIGSEQRQALAEQFYIVDLGCRLDETAGAFMDTAAVLQNLDLLVTSDTSVAHLAGALGVPVWLALCIGCDWRFFQHGEDNPWYPTMRLIRQTRFGDWDEVFARIAEELASGRAYQSPKRERGASLAHASGSDTPRRSPVDLAQKWSRALAQHQAGEHAEAEMLCRELLDAEPCHAEALNLLGALAHQRGQNELARERLERAAVLRPQDAGFHYNLGVARQVLGQTREAAASYRQTLRFQPDHASALNNLGFALLSLGQHTEAQGHLQQAVRLKPDYVEAHINLGEAYLRQGELENAAASLERALQLRPDRAEPHKRMDEAAAPSRSAVQMTPNFAAVHYNRGLALSGLERYDEAVASYDEVVRLDPDHADARFARAMLWLIQGDFERGWRDYEYRWQFRPSPKPAGSQPTWDGSQLKGQTILLWAEQGLGDTIHFIRYASLVKQQGGTVVVQCPAKLTRLLSGCPGIDRLVPHDAPLPPYDVQAPLLSLPRILATTLETVPADAPYLHADNELVEHWRRELSSLSGFRVGIAWQGEPAYCNDRDRSIPLRHFASLARVAGVRLFSLQKGPGTEQLRETAALFAVTDLGPRLDEKGDAFADTAAAMKCLDLVITSDTAVAHLAGALGAPVWLALMFAPEWRWLLYRQDSPWYPTMRLFRQARRGDWQGVFARMANELRRAASGAASAPREIHTRGADATPLAVAVPISPGELIDKITILEIKMDQIRDTAKLANVRAELADLAAAHDRWISNSAELEQLTVELKTVNETLWQVEDDIRACERVQDFGPRFIELARSVYRHNDRRSAIKRQINERLGSRLLEEKSYASY